MVTVPSAYQQYVDEAAQGTGLPPSVVAAQANAESGFNANAVSSTGAEGWLQFEPTTYDAYAQQSGVPANTEFNIGDETKVYITYMNQLLSQEGGSVFKALEAYNAGPGNLSAGSSYASGILKNAGVSQSLNSKGNPATLTGFNPLNPLGSIESGVANGIAGSIESILGSAVSGIFSSLGIPSLKDLLQRLGLIILGAVLIITGLVMFSKSGSQAINITTSSATDEATGQTTNSRSVKTPVSKHTSTVKSAAKDAAEVAAVA